MGVEGWFLVLNASNTKPKAKPTFLDSDICRCPGPMVFKFLDLHVLGLCFLDFQISRIFLPMLSRLHGWYI